MNVIRKSFAGAYTDNGGMEGYASVYGNVDRGGDRVMPGAFGKDPFSIPLFAYHETPIGRADCTPDAHGLHVRAELANTEKAQEARELMRVGAIPSMSFGYGIKRADDNEHGGKDLFELDAMEASVVPIPMNPAATVLAVKAFGQSASMADAVDTAWKHATPSANRAAAYMQVTHDALAQAGATCANSDDGDGKSMKANASQRAYLQVAHNASVLAGANCSGAGPGDGGKPGKALRLLLAKVEADLLV